MDQQPTKATFVSRDVQSAAQIKTEQLQREINSGQSEQSFQTMDHTTEGHDTIHRQTFDSYRYKHAYAGKKSRKKRKESTSVPYSKRMGRRLAICCVIAVGCLGLKYVKLPFAQQTTDFLKNAFTYDLNIEETIGRLQFVQNILPDVTAVFGDQQQFDYPVSGAIIQKYGEDGKEYIQFQAQPNAEVTAVLDGQIEKRGINDSLGKYLKVRHANHLTTVYYGLDQSNLAEGTDVKQGQAIGTLGENGLLCFQVLSGDTPKDPQKYLGVK